MLAGVLAEDIKIYGSPPCNRGKQRNWDYRVLGSVAAGEKGSIDITQIYVMRFGKPPIGKRLFIRARQQMNGWQGKPWDASAVVPPRQGGSGSRKDRQGKGTTQGV